MLPKASEDEYTVAGLIFFNVCLLSVWFASSSAATIVIQNATHWNQEHAWFVSRISAALYVAHFRMLLLVWGLLSSALTLKVGFYMVCSAHIRMFLLVCGLFLSKGNACNIVLLTSEALSNERLRLKTWERRWKGEKATTMMQKSFNPTPLAFLSPARFMASKKYMEDEDNPQLTGMTTTGSKAKIIHHNVQPVMTMCKQGSSFHHL